MPAGDAVYPIFLKLAGRRVLVVGAGEVAARKAASLADSNASVCVVAPEACPEVQELARSGRIRWKARPFRKRDADGAWLLVAATSDPETQRLVARTGEARRAFVIAVDDAPNATAYSGAVVRRAPFTIAISSSGATPAMTRLLREIIEHVLPGEDWIAQATRVRARWIAEATPIGDRFGQLVSELAAKARWPPPARRQARRAGRRPRRR